MSPYWLLIILLFPAAYIFLLTRKSYRTLKKLEAARYHIARDLHDDIGATLSSISFFTQAVRQQIVNGNTTHTIHTLDRIGTLSREMMDSMSDIVWMVNPGNDSTESLFEKIDDYGTNLFPSRNVTFLFYADPAVLSTSLSMDMRKEYFLICKEAMNNAVKYAACSAFEVLITKEGLSILTIIKDNGKGFTAAEVKPGNGLLNMKVRAANLGGKLELRSAIGKGTTLSFSFAIPPKW